MRTEYDALGEVKVPLDKYYGAQTQRAIQNFHIGSETFPCRFIQAHALLKKAAAFVNADLGLLEESLKVAICQAAEEIIEGKLNAHFPLFIWQSGSGTQFNMNMNEVIANRAIEILGGKIGRKSPVHPNDHVNMSQSTNDTIPTSMHIATVISIHTTLLPALTSLIEGLQKKVKHFSGIIKIGRTHLQDATPLSLGQEFSGYVAQVDAAKKNIEWSLLSLYELPIGGTAVGTGMNTNHGYDKKMVVQINQLTDMPFRVSDNKFAAMAAHDAIVLCSGTLKTLAAALMKIANDIRWLASGPRCGIGELNLPCNEPGSSIMPGKVNPTQCEMLSMIVCQVYGNDTSISMAGSQGNFELNVYKPLMVFNILQSIQLLADGCQSFQSHCINDLQANEAQVKKHLDNSLMLVTALNEHIGYDKAAKIALTAWQQGTSLKATAQSLGYVSEDEFDRWVQPEKMLAPKV